MFIKTTFTEMLGSGFFVGKIPCIFIMKVIFG